MPPVPPKPIRWAIYALTVVGWITVSLRALVPGVDEIITDEQARLGMLVAAVGTLKWLVRRMMSPAHELFQAGKRCGYADGHAAALAELDGSVVRLDERRELRVVESDRARVTTE